jgi:hypothetical protein
MGEILRNSVENKRKKLIKKLLSYNVYKKEDKHLFELSLTDLESEYRKFKSQSHPHIDIGSIKLTGHKSNNESF